MLSRSSSRSSSAVVAALLVLLPLCFGAAVASRHEPVTLMFKPFNSSDVCALVSLKAFSASISHNETRAGLVQLPEFNATSATFTPHPMASCGNLSESSTQVTLSATFALHNSTTTANVVLAFNATTTSGKVSKWYLSDLAAVIHHEQQGDHAITVSYPSASRSTFVAPAGYGLRCRANAVFENVTQGVTVVEFQDAILQPFNVRRNQTQPQPKRGERFDICQFQKDEQDHTLALAIAGGVGALCLCAIVVYFIRSRHKTAYTSLS
ncbi:hypothetical protein PTSG_07419 [Salpingoeca rosetta]|uniref:Uncharacterized protein n=1 Tax=Salpingoeca rosetta (strain ATCC 50818 / BSB-021) TaxID=946362 RepID=F2UIN2_SALR5|nr:uncharacterized protein PTSG_07419 [Salpingoeca rosetta]EGD77081.1 hypothetical protein PTSG_07419 [Salpingoeca rosetta]|eukprot:XP_004990920.1 hypothetical protein PTSG_07419 [Salpingoeca rosetta]